MVRRKTPSQQGTPGPTEGQAGPKTRDASFPWSQGPEGDLLLLGEEELVEQAGPSSATVLENPLMTPKQVPKASVVRTSPTAPREPVNGLQKEVQTVAQSLHRRHEHRGDKYKN